MHTDTAPTDKSALDRLVASHREFLTFLERRTHSREEAEEILQSAFVRTVERADSLRPDDNVVAWFYRLLRNALVDRARRRAAEGRLLERVASELDEAGLEELEDVVCRCIKELVPTLDPKHAALIERVDLGGEAISALAEREGITANNARVRLHRAREALRQSVVASCGTCATHGCRDCSCNE